MGGGWVIKYIHMYIHVQQLVYMSVREEADMNLMYAPMMHFIFIFNSIPCGETCLCYFLRA